MIVQQMYFFSHVISNSINVAKNSKKCFVKFLTLYEVIKNFSALFSF